MFKLMSDRRALETLEWGALAAAIVVVAYAAYSIFGAQLAAFISSLGGMF